MIFELANHVPDVLGSAASAPDDGLRVRHHVELPLGAGQVLQHQPQSGLRPERLEDVFDFPQAVAPDAETVDGEDLVAGPEALRFRIGPGPHLRDQAAITHHQPAPAVVVVVRSQRDEEPRVRVVERIEQSGDVRHRPVQRLGLVDLDLGRCDPRIPVEAVKTRVVIVLFDVVRDVAKHVLDPVPIGLRELTERRASAADGDERDGAVHGNPPRKVSSFYHTRQGFSLTIGAPVLQEKARANCGRSATMPLMRYLPGECGFVTAFTRSFSGRVFSQAHCAKPMKNRWSGVKPSASSNFSSCYRG